MIKLPSFSSASGQPSGPAIVLVPADRFFCRRAEITEGMGESDLPEFAELLLEEHAPFPLEQLAWGYVRQHHQLLVFAAPRIRLENTETWPEARHVLPAFWPLLATGFTGPCLLRYQNLLTFLPAAPEPFRPRHLPLPEDTDEEQLPALAANWQGCTEGQLPPLFTLEGIQISRTGQLLPQWKPLLGDAPDSAPTPATEAWNADLRDAEDVRRLRRELMLASRLWLGLQAGMAVAVLLLVLTILWLGLSWHNAQQRAAIAELAPRVEALNSNQLHVERLQDFSGEPFEPFTVLEQVNALRPRNVIWFRAVSLQSDGEVTIEGFAQLVNQVNEYQRKLLETGRFEEIMPPDSGPRNGRIQFTLQLRHLGSPDQTPTETSDS